MEYSPTVLVRAYDGEPLRRVVIHETHDCYYGVSDIRGC